MPDIDAPAEDLVGPFVHEGELDIHAVFIQTNLVTGDDLELFRRMAMGIEITHQVIVMQGKLFLGQHCATERIDRMACCRRDILRLRR